MNDHLRGYQRKMSSDIDAAWQAGAIGVMAQLATGGGKTVVIGDKARNHAGVGIAVAHRQELVGQISVALGREGIRHNIFAPDAVVRQIAKEHIGELGRSFISPHANWSVAGIRTLIGKELPTTYTNSVTMGVIDEAHHVLAENEWGKGVAMFPASRWLLPTATPIRADGKGLGRHHDGLADVIVEGPSMRDLIDMGYLTDYTIYTPTTEDLDLDGVDISATTGDFNQGQVRKAVHRSKKIVGDVVDSYLKYARGKLGVTFAVDVASAVEIADAFRRAGVPAEVVSAKTHPDLRRSILAKFRAREILQLVNVDLFGEGFDLPAIEVVSMARPTQSFSLFCQQFGRSLRLMISKVLMGAWETYSPERRKRFISESGKPIAIIIDHVGNVYRHNLPDKPRVWSLDRRGKRGSQTINDAIPLRPCTGCLKPYERSRLQCPYCQNVPEPAQRSGPEFVDGDLIQLSPEVLAMMRGEVAKLDASPIGWSNQFAINGRLETQAAQRDLRWTINCWAGAHPEYSDRENQKRFYLLFGVDVVSACSLTKSDANALREKIVDKLKVAGVSIPDIEYALPTTHH